MTRGSTGFIFMFAILCLALGLAGCGQDDNQDDDQDKGKTRSEKLMPEQAEAEDTQPADDPGEGEQADTESRHGFTLEKQSAPVEETPAVTAPTGSGQEPAAVSNQEPVSQQPARRPEPVYNDGSLGEFSLQVGSFVERSNAEKLVDRLRELGHSPEVKEIPVDGIPRFRVLLRGLPDAGSARSLGEDLRSALGIDYLVLQR